jgi:hypothetical protein
VIADGGTIDSNGLFNAGLVAGNYLDTVQASIWGISGTASVDVFLPVLDHFTFEPIEAPVFMDTPFTVTITARDEAENLVLTYANQVSLSDTTGLIVPSTTGNFTSGSWTGEVTIGQANHQVTITASDGSATGSSGPFEVLPLPDDYQVTSSTYQHLPGKPFLVTVTATDSGGGEDTGILDLRGELGAANQLRPGGGSDPGIWAMSPQVPVLITMSASSGTLVFDGDSDGIFGETGDDSKYMFGGSFSIMARDPTPGREVSIIATDIRGRYGYNVYAFLYVNFLPAIFTGNP